MQAIKRFERSFTAFVQVIYGDHTIAVDSNLRQVIYTEVFEDLLHLLAAQGIAYDTFIEQELQYWAKAGSTGNPLELPFEGDFLQLYADEDHKYSLLVICLQTQVPKKDISAALIQACHTILTGTSAYSHAINFLEFLAKYPNPNPNAIALIESIISLLNEDWYNQELSFYIRRILIANPGLAATASQQKFEQLETEIEHKMRFG